MIPKNHWLLLRPIAHRGLHNEIFPENSLPAFENAVKHECPIELDVHLSSDGVLFVFHDDNAKRMTGLDADINQLTMSEIKQLRLKKPDADRDSKNGAAQDLHHAEERGAIHDTHQEFDIPTLDEVLKTVAGKVPLLIETKSNSSFGHSGKLEEKLHERLLTYEEECAAAGRVCEIALQSFDPRSIRKMKKLEGSYMTGQLAQDMSRKKLGKLAKWLLAGCRLNFYGKPDFISYKAADLPVPRIMAKHERGMLLLGWTVRSEEDEKMARKYCDNIIFEKYSPAAYSDQPTTYDICY